MNKMIRELCYDYWGVILEYTNENTIYSILLTFKDTINNVWCIKVNTLGYSYNIKYGKLCDVVINLGNHITFVKTKRLIKYGNEILLNFDYHKIAFKDNILMELMYILDIFKNYAYKITLDSNVFTNINYELKLYKLYKILCKYKFTKDDINYVSDYASKYKFDDCFNMLELNNTIFVNYVSHILYILRTPNNFKHIIFPHNFNEIIIFAKQSSSSVTEEDLNKFNIIKEENKTIFHRK